jgi:hypothetical protein
MLDNNHVYNIIIIILNIIQKTYQNIILELMLYLKTKPIIDAFLIILKHDYISCGNRIRAQGP